MLKEYPDALFRFVGRYPPRTCSIPTSSSLAFLEDYPGALKQAGCRYLADAAGLGIPDENR